MRTNDNDVNYYANMLHKFRRKLHSAAKEKKLFPLIGDREIEVSQRMADRLRADPKISDQAKQKITQNHVSFVKFVWNL